MHYNYAMQLIDLLQRVNGIIENQFLGLNLTNTSSLLY
jgi:hypothetical protein